MTDQSDTPEVPAEPLEGTPVTFRQEVPLGNQFMLVFEASGVVGKGTAEAVPGEEEPSDGSD